MKTWQTAQDPQKIVASQVAFGKDLELKMRDLVNTTSNSVQNAQQQVMDLLKPSAAPKE